VQCAQCHSRGTTWKKSKLVTCVML
jgi:hypothetical protein